jgi:hypothetical protein
MSRSSSRIGSLRRQNQTQDGGEDDPLLSSAESLDKSRPASYRSFPSLSGSPTAVPSADSPSSPTEQTDLASTAAQSEATLTIFKPLNAGFDISITRRACIVLALGILVFLQASNISLLTTTQGVIAGDLDAFESVSWFTSAYLIPMSSLSPLYGKLSYIFPAKYCLFGSSLILTMGAVITAASPSLGGFLLGRVVTGIGGAGVLTFAQVLIQLVSSKRRGLAQGKHRVQAILSSPFL